MIMANPRYRVTGKIFFGEKPGFMEVVLPGAELETDQEPNFCMEPLNEEARVAYTLFQKRVGDATADPLAPLPMTVGAAAALVPGT